MVLRRPRLLIVDTDPVTVDFLRGVARAGGFTPLAITSDFRPLAILLDEARQIVCVNPFLTDPEGRRMVDALARSGAFPPGRTFFLAHPDLLPEVERRALATHTPLIRLPLSEQGAHRFVRLVHACVSDPGASNAGPSPHPGERAMPTFYDRREKERRRGERRTGDRRTADRRLTPMDWSRLSTRLAAMARTATESQDQWALYTMSLKNMESMINRRSDNDRRHSERRRQPGE